ncbi:MAG: Uma2 family endonuclease [Nitrospirae bacterium]|nr:Uma2 family endonuclease [Nitrospirota bacterium]
MPAIRTSDVTEKKYTYADYLLIEDEKRYEIHEGELIMVPAPNTGHQRISWEIEFIMGKFVKENNLGTILDAPTDVVLAEGVVLQPDILFISKDREDIIKPRAVMAPPDLVVEIASPSTSYYDTVKKRDLYQRYGVKEFWLVFPEENAIEVMTLEEGVYREFASATGEGKVKSKVLSGLEVDLKEVFAGG